VRALLFFLLLAPTAAWSQAGRTAAPFLQNNLGAAAAGMGGAFTAVKRRIDAGQYNPATLATLTNPTLTSTYLNAFGSTNYGALTYAHPLPFGTLSAGAVYFNAGQIELNLSNGQTGTVTAEEDTAWSLSYAKELALGLSVGGTYRHVRMTLAETASATSNLVDGGVHWATPVSGLSLGGAYQYIGPDITFEEVGDPPPKTMRAGASFQFPDLDPTKVDPSVQLDEFDMTAAVDYESALHADPLIRSGLELGVRPFQMNRVAIRVGWVVGGEAETWSFGLGFLHKGFRFDYAFGSGGELGSRQHVTMTMYFGKGSSKADFL